MKKKRQFHCQKCNSSCEIYKKGKKHRVLICPACGILATNPLPLLAIAAGRAILPSLIAKGGEMIANRGEKKAKSSDSVSCSSKLTQFEKALLLERAERGRG